jgi:hypothetical protein
MPARHPALYSNCSMISRAASVHGFWYIHATITSPSSIASVALAPANSCLSHCDSFVSTCEVTPLTLELPSHTHPPAGIPPAGTASSIQITSPGSGSTGTGCLTR